MSVLERLKQLHSIGFVHRDIKPANIVIGSAPGTSNNFYLIDFGLSRKHSMTRSAPKEIFEMKNLRLTGTPIYASVNSHLGWANCFRKDDIESLMYVMVHLHTGLLPW